MSGKRDQKEYHHEYHKAHKQQVSDNHVLWRYKITPKQYKKMLKGQDGVCAICAGTNPNGTRLFVDHDHDNEVIRGLLCRRCNTSLAWYENVGQDVIEWYLE